MESEPGLHGSCMNESLMHRLLVVGTGSIGERHVRCLLAAGRAEAGIHEINSKFREEAAAIYNWLGEAFKCFPVCRQTLEIDDFSPF